MKKNLYIVVAVIVILFTASFIKDMAVKVSVEKGTEMITGLKLNMRGISVGLLKTAVRIRGLRLYNPAGFKERVMLDMPDIYVDYDLSSILSGTIHLEDVFLNMNELIVIKNEKGELNLNALKIVKEGKTGKDSQQAEKKEFKIQIDKLRLKVGKVIYRDYSRGSEPYIKEYNINIDETYNDIDNPNTLVSLIIVRSLANTSISSMTNFDVNGLKSGISGTLKHAHKAAANAALAAGESAKKTQEVFGKTAESLQGAFKNPFSSKE